jgi:cytosine/adenosine deaminase-related metal-dependent hydrolase
MATVNGARAIRQHGKLGELKRGSFADIIALPFSGAMGDLASTVIQHNGNVGASLIGGEWAIDPRS